MLHPVRGALGTGTHPGRARPRRTLEVMLLRRALTALVVGALASLAGCDDGGRPASVGDPDVSSSTAPSTSTSTSAFPTYVALGDSYTAAPGVPQTETKTGC